MFICFLLIFGTSVTRIWLMNEEYLFGSQKKRKQEWFFFLKKCLYIHFTHVTYGIRQGNHAYAYQFHHNIYLIQWFINLFPFLSYPYQISLIIRVSRCVSGKAVHKITPQTAWNRIFESNNQCAANYSPWSFRLKTMCTLTEAMMSWYGTLHP